MYLIRKFHFSIIALTVIVFSAWMVLKTEKSPSNLNIRNPHSGRHSISQVSDSTPISSSGNVSSSEKLSATNNTSTLPVQAEEIVKNKTDDSHDHTQLESVKGKVSQEKGVAVPPAINDPRALRPFGKGAPFTIGDLPDGKLKENLLTLTPDHKDKALKWLHSFTFNGIDAIDSLRADKTGGIFYTCFGAECHGKGCVNHSHPTSSSTESASVSENSVEATSKSTAPVAASTAAAVSIANPPIYNSKPGATKHIYLDFNGANVSGKAWSESDGTNTWTSWDCYVWGDTDGTKTEFSVSDQDEMRRVWERIAEDYAPFDVNVTTDTLYDPDNTSYTGDRNQVGWLLFTPTTDKDGGRCPHYGSGGVAYLGVFGQSNYFSTYQPAWILPAGAANMAEAASHEMGHNMGLSHDTRSDEGYYGGHGSGDTSWGPIMGTGYNRNVSQWSKGEYFDSKHAYWNVSSNSYNNNPNTNDDLLIISDRVSYRIDDHGGTNATATELTASGDGSFSSTGIIERTSETDVFSIIAGEGPITLNANPYEANTGTNGGNLDILMELYDSGGSLITSNNNAVLTTATISTTLSAGTYYVHIRPTGAGNQTGVGSPYDPTTNTRAGYTIYGSMGQYTLNGNLVLPGVSITESGGTNVIENGATDTYSISLGSEPSSSVTVNITPNSQVTTNKSNVVFTIGNWSEPQTVTVAAVDDTLEEGSHTGTITHTSNSSDSAFDGIGVGGVIVNITDNDSTVVISPNGGGNWIANIQNTITWTSGMSGNVRIELLKNGSLNKTITTNTPNDGSFLWTSPLNQTLGSEYKIRIQSVENSSRIDESDTTFSIIALAVAAAVPYNESFETSYGIWATQTSIDTLNWTRDSGGTTSGNTGPTTGQNSNYYLYTEATNNFNKTAELSYWFDLRPTVSPVFSFYYHMYGSTMGTLKVEASIDDYNWTTIFSESGDKGDVWNSAQVDLSAYAGKYLKLKISGLTGSSFTSDMAVDQLSLVETATTTYTVSYNNDASISGNVPRSQVKGEGISLNLADAGTMTNSGYVCTGWNSAANGSGTAYALGSSYTDEDDLNLYAQWSTTLFEEWTGGGLLFSGDTNEDGVANGLAWLLGAPNPSAASQTILPGGSESSGNLVMTFSYLNAANRGSAVICIQYSQDLGLTDSWTNNTVVIPESDGTVDGVDFVITPNGNVNEVQATIPAGTPGSSIFSRVLGDVSP